MAAKKFSPKTLNVIRQAKIVGICAGRGHHRVIGVWVVVALGRVFIRSWRVSPEGWFHSFKGEPFGPLTVGERALRVTAIITKSEAVKRKVSEAYAEKYNTPGSLKYVRDFARTPSRDATVELIPSEKIGAKAAMPRKAASMKRAGALAFLALLGAVPVAAQERAITPTPRPGGLVAADGCPSSPDAITAVLRRLIEADNARDLQTVLDSYTDDVVFLPPTGEVVLGKAAVADRYRTLFAASQPRLTTAVSEVVTSGDLAFVRGINSGRIESPAGGEPTPVNDNYLGVLSCAGGTWRIARLAWIRRASAPVPDGAVPVEQEPEHKTVFKNDYVQVFRVTLEPGKSTGMHIHAHDDAAVRLSTATITSNTVGAAGTPESRAAGSVSARQNEPKALTHQVRNVGTTLFDVLDVQVLKRPDGPDAAPIMAPAAENPRMRVYRYDLAPGARSAMHTHARPYLIVAATDMNLRMTAPDGMSRAHPIKAGDLHWIEVPVTHTLGNDGTEKGVLVEFELK